MKNYSKITNILGGVALFLAAFFILVLLPQYFNFGNFNNTIIGKLGNALVGAFGLTSAFIPVFFVAVGIISISSFWTEKTGAMLAFSFIPFLTIAGIEYITTKLFDANIPTMIFIRFISFFSISAILCGIEYITIGLLFETIHKKKQISQIKTIPTYSDPMQPLFEEEQYNLESELDAAYEEFVEQEKIERIEEIQVTPQSFPESFAVPEKDTFSFIQVGEDEVNALLGDFEDVEPMNAEVYSSEQELNVEDEKPLTIEEATNNLPEQEKFEEPLFVEPAQEVATEKFDPIEEIEEIEDYDDIDEYEFENEIEENIINDSYSEYIEDFDSIEDTNEEYDEEPVIDNDPVLIEEDISEIVTKTFGEAHKAQQENIKHAMKEIDVAEEELPLQPELPTVNEATPPISTVQKPIGKKYSIPSDGVLKNYSDGEYWLIDDATRQGGVVLEQTLSEFKIEAKVTGIRKGPVVTMYEMLPAPGVKLSKIVNLADNIALRLAAPSIRIVAPIPGKHAVGIEVPNKKRSIVGFKELIDMNMEEFEKMAVPVVLGKDISGEAQVIDLAKTPHLLIAGATGAGKSVCVNSLILSILYKRSFRDVKMILIDPKVVELKLYNDIPHLLTPVITEPKKAFQALQYCLCEMERRYALLDGMGVRDISNYNKRIIERGIATEKLPYIVLIIDEFADLMATTGKELESTVARLAAMSRAVGIHLVLATQRPSIDVITGLIKANIPSRIAFMVASKTDSRIIIDQVGADKLLGKGDMLYAGPVDPFPVRIQGTFVSDDEVEQVCNYVKQFGEPDYIDDEIFVEDEDGFEPSAFDGTDDPLYDQALEIVMQSGKASASYIQRRLKIGYNRAARLVEDMEARGIVGPANGSKPREVLHMI